MIDQIVQDLEALGYSYQKSIVSADKLMQLGSLFEQEFTPARIGKAVGPKRVDEIRGDWIFWLDPQNPPAQLSAEMQFLETLKLKLNQHFYLGLKDFECHLAKYPAESFYKKHLDRFEKDSSRSLSFVFYLHPEWTKADGGELVLYNKDQSVLKTILPEPGSMIVFLSEEFPHEVKICHKERRSLTGWMHTKILT